MLVISLMLVMLLVYLMLVIFLTTSCLSCLLSTSCSPSTVWLRRAPTEEGVGSVFDQGEFTVFDQGEFDQRNAPERFDRFGASPRAD